MIHCGGCSQKLCVVAAGARWFQEGEACELGAQKVELEEVSGAAG